MKFLCDRCKTRYSIGDDRVRGKILKIRCKNCANVITVREGMTDVEAAADPAPRRNSRPTTMAPPPATPPSGNGALGAAFASALTTKPPAALEEEWYLSDDGEQEGPFSLTEAQAWVGAKGIDADLHCWSEGFDDWLPVDKVSHFRGLRKKPPPMPAPSVPPPMPRSPGMGARMGAQSVEDEPKPLFAATMAALEKGATAPTPANRLGLPPTSARPSATPSGGTPAIQARANGSASAGIKPAPAVTTKPAPVKPIMARQPSPRAGTVPGVGSKGGAPFGDANDQATQIEAPPFDDEALTAAEPVAAAAKRLSADANDAFATAAARHIGGREDAATSPASPRFNTSGPASAPTAAAAPSAAPVFNDDDDELSIGEVSRVVRIADISPRVSDPSKRTPAPALTRGTASQPRLATAGFQRINSTGAVARLNATGSVNRIEDPNAPNGAASPFGEPQHDMAAVPAPVAAHHRRGLIILIGVAGLLLAGVVVAVVLLMGGENVTNSTLAGGDTIDTTRPDDPTRRANPNDPGPGSAINPFFPPKANTGSGKRPPPNINTTPPTGSAGKTEDLPTGSLRSDEVEEMARKYSGGTERCWMRSQKGAEQFEYQNLKKIQATLSIGADGAVKDVQLSSHGTSTLGKCLIGSIKSWKFRTSPGGTFKISLQFVSG